MEVHRVVRTNARTEEVNAVHVPLGEQVRPDRADVQGNNRNLVAKMFLDDVRLEVVRGPAHRCKRLQSLGPAQPVASRQTSINGGKLIRPRKVTPTIT